MRLGNQTSFCFGIFALFSNIFAFSSDLEIYLVPLICESFLLPYVCLCPLRPLCMRLICMSLHAMYIYTYIYIACNSSLYIYECISYNINIIYATSVYVSDMYVIAFCMSVHAHLYVYVNSFSVYQCTCLSLHSTYTSASSSQGLFFFFSSFSSGLHILCILLDSLCTCCIHLTF